MEQLDWREDEDWDGEIECLYLHPNDPWSNVSESYSRKDTEVEKLEGRVESGDGCVGIEFRYMELNLWGNKAKEGEKENILIFPWAD
ncbi:unnamed protein product [Larinioides sclopetarius]|uniref:Uncharacterized protein n=1 Tax=Larinioides sclopetarius TaxID=280406 RepID=A0AAV2AIP0_9ARAC